MPSFLMELKYNFCISLTRMGNLSPCLLDSIVTVTSSAVKPPAFTKGRLTFLYSPAPSSMTSSFTREIRG